MEKSYQRNLPAGLLLSLLVLLLSGCSSNTLPQASVYPSLTTDAEDYQYLIGPGDVVNIFVWRNPEVSGSFAVRPDGKITTSLVEDIPVTGKTPTQLARQIEEELSKYLRDPIVTVTISGFIGPLSEQIRVIGEATNPRTLNYRQQMTLLDVMIAVGGLTEFADGNDARLIRTIDGEQHTFEIHLNDLLRHGEISANADVLPGDIIIIPEAWF